jgi:hypothetical protein
MFFGGVPYIAKWTEGSDIVNPEFANVTITSARYYVGDNTKVAFEGTYAPISFDAEDKSILVFGEGNKTISPLAGDKIDAFSGYFELIGTFADYNENGTKLILNNLDGDYVLGDVNGDGAVDVSDYIGVANDILGIEQPTFNKEAADVDKSGVIDVTDYLGVGNIIHTGSPFGITDASIAAKKAATNPEDVDNVIYVEDLQVEPGTTEATLSVQMKNTAEIRGFQFDLYLPEGVSVTVNAKGKIQGAALNENRLLEDDEHSLTSSKQADGAVRFLCGSQYQETFTGNSGELMTINVKLDEGMANGEYVIAIKNQKLSENDITKSYETELVESILTVGNATPTGINEVLTSQNTTNVVYDLQGH